VRIGSASDFHFGAGVDEDVSASLSQAREIFRESKVDLIVIPGDIFHAKSNPDSRNAAASCIHGFSAVAPVLICYGNHDVAGDLDIFRRFHGNFILPVSKPEIIIFPEPADPSIQFHVLPWFTKATWQACHPEIAKEEGDLTVSQAALQYLKIGIECNRTASKHILVSHLVIDGARAENHQPLIGEGIKFGEYDLREAGFYAGIFGHIHLRQQFLDGLFFYNGSPAALDYGESPEKFCSVMDTESNAVEWHQLKTTDRYTVDLEWKDGRVQEFDTARVPGARVRVNLKIPEGEDRDLAQKELQTLLDRFNPVEIKINFQIQPTGLVRAVEITSAETPEQKLDAYWKSTGKLPEEVVQADMKAKLAELRLSTPEAPQ
jgi:DNA repair exonuclease SbcCD nuclease subunit